MKSMEYNGKESTDRRQMKLSTKDTAGSAIWMNQEEFDTQFTSSALNKPKEIILRISDEKAVCLPTVAKDVKVNNNRNILLYEMPGCMKSRAFIRL